MSLSGADVAKISGMYVSVTFREVSHCGSNLIILSITWKRWLGWWRKNLAHNAKSNVGHYVLKMTDSWWNFNLNFLVGWAIANNIHFNISKRKVLHLAIKNVGDVCSGKQWLCKSLNTGRQCLQKDEEVALRQCLVLKADSDADVSRYNSKMRGSWKKSHELDESFRKEGL